MTRSLFRTTLLTIALVTMAGAASAQSVWNFELVTGVNFTKLGGDDTDARVIFNDPDLGSADVSGDIGSMKLGFTVGGLMTVAVNENFAIQSGLLWARKGGDGEITLRGNISGLGVVDLTADVTMTLDYIDIPILGVFSFPAGESLGMRVLVGPVLSFNTNAEVEISLAGTTESTDIGDEIKPVDVGGLIGFGLVVPVGTTLNFHADARYTMGFTSIDDSGSDIDIKNRGFALMVGLGIPLNG